MNDFIEEIEKNYEIIGNYNGKTKPITLKHKKCNTQFSLSEARNLFRYNKEACPVCHKNEKYLKKELKFKKEVYDLVGDEYEVLGNFINVDSKILIKHNTCGYEYEVTPTHFQQGKRCPKCARKSSITTDNFIQEVKNLYNDEYEVIGEYTRSNDKVLIKHNTCGYEYEVLRKKFILGKCKCPNCSSSNNYKKTNEEFAQDVFNKVNDEYEILEDYINNKTPILMKHNTCGYEWKCIPNVFLNNGSRCPKCAKNSFSNKEEEVKLFLESIYKKEIQYNNRKILDNKKELDIYIPEKKLAIEFDGLYWHSELFKDKYYHFNKTLECQEKGIHLIHIFEDEWYYNKEIVKDKLKSKLNSLENKIGARKCYIDEITNDEKKEFLNNNHIQGSDKSNIKLGLFYPQEDGDILVAVMTLKIPTSKLNKEKYDYELSRYATQLNYSVTGGFSKLLNYFKENYEWNKLVTYADLRWSQGNVYLKNGFKEVSEINKNNISYDYCSFNNYKCGSRYSREIFQKYKLKEKFPKLYSDDKSEKEIMKEAGFLRIYDCGNMVFEYNK